MSMTGRAISLTVVVTEKAVPVENLRPDDVVEG